MPCTTMHDLVSTPGMHNSRRRPENSSSRPEDITIPGKHICICGQACIDISASRFR